MLGHSWDIWKEQGSMKFIIRDWKLACFAAKFLNNPNVITSTLPDFSLYKTEPFNDSLIVKKLWKTLHGVDVVVTQNGIKFDIPKANAKFLEYGLTPPPPYKQVDTCQIAKRKFGFSSNKLDDIAKLLRVGRKIDTGGFELWDRAMRGEQSAWNKMKRYNINDVILLEKIYKKMLPYIDNHPNYAVMSGVGMRCPKCGSFKIIKQGYGHRVGSIVQRFQCRQCGGWCCGDKVLKNLI